MRISTVLMLSLLLACTPAGRSQPVIEIVQVYASPAAGPWLSDLYACADKHSLGVNFDSRDARITLWVGEPEDLDFPAFQIDEEELLVVVHRGSLVQDLSLEQAQELFEGRGNPSVQVWVYSPESDLQQAFNRLVMQDRRISPFARIATSPQQMPDVLNADVNAVGILPRRWMAEGMRQVYEAGVLPVLAITSSEPQGSIITLIDCLQK